MLAILLSMAYGHDLVRSGVVDPTGQFSLEVERVRNTIEVFEVRFGVSGGAQTAHQVLAFGPRGAVTLTREPGGEDPCEVARCTVLDPRTAAPEDLDLEPAQLDRLLRALDGYGVDPDVPLFEIHAVLARQSSS
jgi:hypothetical protein